MESLLSHLLKSKSGRVMATPRNGEKAFPFKRLSEGRKKGNELVRFSGKKRRVGVFGGRAKKYSRVSLNV